MQGNRRKSILCPHCSKLISVAEQTCPHCGISRPGARWKNIPVTRGLLQRDQLIKTIIYANVGMYLISLLMNPTRMGLSANPFMFLSPSNGALLLLGSTGTIPIDQGHRWWTLVSANYLHGGILHIVFNMIALYQIGPLVLREYGANRLIGSRGGAYGQAIYKQISGWVLVLFLFGFLVPGINNWGHGGGIVGGIILGYFLGYNERTRENLFHKSLAGVCVVLTVAVLAWAVLSSLYYRFLG
jgi:rhomboid protease GluP